MAFRREAALLATVDHPSLAVIHEVGDVGGRPYLVMDLVEGETLAGVLAAGALPAARVISLARDVVAPLAAAHRRGLSGRLADVPLMLLATARDKDNVAAADAVVAALGGTVELDLELPPLDERGVAELVAALLPGMKAGPSLARLLTVRSGGNPFVVGEYLRAVVDAGLLVPSWGTWLLDADALAALEVPQEALGLVLARERNLGPQVRELLVTAAVCGAQFLPDVVAAVHGLGIEVALAATWDATTHGLVEPSGGGRYAFVHHRIREALTDQLDPAGAARLHQRLAQVLEAMPVPPTGHDADHVYAVARHYLAGEVDAAPDRAFAACWAAGQRALDDYAPADAVEFLQYAAAVAAGGRPDGDVVGVVNGVNGVNGVGGVGGVGGGGGAGGRVDGGVDSRFLVALGTARKQNGQFEDAVEAFDQVLAVETEPLRRAETSPCWRTPTDPPGTPRPRSPRSSGAWPNWGRRCPGIRCCSR